MTENLFATLLSPFPLQGIYDGINDWALVDPGEFGSLENISKCLKGSIQDLEFPSPDLAAIGYFGDGKALHARLWLSSTFQEPTALTSYNFEPIERSYSLLVDVDSAYDIGQNYQVVIAWDPVANNWNKMIREAPPPLVPGKYVTYNEQSNHTGFYGKGRNYVDLSFNLSEVSNPQEFSVSAYMSETYRTNNSNICHLIDITDTVHIPPPEFEISTLPSSVTLRPGEEKTLELGVKNINTKLNSHILLSANKVNGLNLTFIPNQMTVPPKGTSMSILQIKTDEDLLPRPYTVPIFADISFPTTFTNYMIGQAFNNTPSAHLSKTYDLTITIQYPLTFQQHMVNFLDSWFTPVTGAYTTIATIITGIVAWRIWKRQKKLRE